MAVLDLERLQVCECPKCFKEAPVKGPTVLPVTDPDAPVRVTMITKNLKTGQVIVTTNKGKPGKAVAAKASTKRRVKKEFENEFSGFQTFTIELPEGEHRIAAI